MKTRIIQTRFWDDEFVSEATKHTKYLYIYLLTSQYINLCGIFQLSDKKIIFETGMTAGELNIAKKELVENKKVLFKNGWIKIVNAEKNNQYRNSPLNEKPYNKELEHVPSDVLSFFDSSIDSSIDSTMDSNIKYKIKNIKYKTKKEGNKNFSEFWEKYPKKIARSKVEKKYPDEKHEEIMKGLEAYLKHWREKKTEMQYIPNPETWLNQERWNDELGKKIAVEPKKVKGIDFFGGYLNA